MDLGGEDFARKLVIIGRMCGSGIDRERVIVEDLVPDELRALPIDEFMRNLTDLDNAMKERVKAAKGQGMRSWYLGTADLQKDAYTVGFENIPMGDMITQSRESDNVLRLFPRGWRRPVTIMGPGAGPSETVTGLISALFSVMERSCRKRESAKN